jgi:hypothetical protein
VSAFLASKVVNALPGVLVASTVYFVRIGAGFDIYVTNESGMVVAYPLNAGGGGGTLSGTATITLPNGRGVLEWTETVAAVGIVPANTVVAFFAAGLDDDENNAEMLDPNCNPVAVAGTDEITITGTFREPTSGPVKIIWKVL